MAEWIYFIHPPRDNFAATMTDEEKAVWSVHFDRFQRMLLDGSLILVGPTLGDTNTGISIFDAPDEAAARKIMDEDPVIAGGFARGELRPFRVSLLRGRDEERAARDLAGGRRGPGGLAHDSRRRPQTRPRLQAASEADLQLQLVPQRDPVVADLRDLRLERLPGLVDRAGTQRRQPEPAPLVEPQGVDVVVRRDHPQTVAAVARGEVANRAISAEPAPDHCRTAWSVRISHSPSRSMYVRRPAG